MKMAKATEQDIEAAGKMMALLNTIDRGYYPERDSDTDSPAFFDEDDPEHLRRFYEEVKATLYAAPGWQGRVIGGMCFVIMFDKNEFIDPASDTLEMHPKIVAALEAVKGGAA